MFLNMPTAFLAIPRLGQIIIIQQEIAIV